jgi:hypothetical protein
MCVKRSAKEFNMQGYKKEVNLIKLNSSLIKTKST